MGIKYTVEVDIMTPRLQVGTPGLLLLPAMWQREEQTFSLSSFTFLKVYSKSKYYLSNDGKLFCHILFSLY